MKSFLTIICFFLYLNMIYAQNDSFENKNFVAFEFGKPIVNDFSLKNYSLGLNYKRKLHRVLMIEGNLTFLRRNNFPSDYQSNLNSYVINYNVDANRINIDLVNWLRINLLQLYPPDQPHLA